MGSGLNRPAGATDTGSRPRPYRGPWDERLAAHLLRRAGFGGSPEDHSQVRIDASARRGRRPARSLRIQVRFRSPARCSTRAMQISALRGSDSTARRQALQELRKEMRAIDPRAAVVVAQPDAEHDRAAAREDDALSSRTLHDCSDSKRRLAAVRVAAEPALSQPRRLGICAS